MAECVRASECVCSALEVSMWVCVEGVRERETQRGGEE